MTLAQRWKNEGERDGLKKGREEGREEGRLEARRSLVGRLLRLKFRSLPPAAERRLAAATSDELTLWADRIVSATTLDDIFA